MSKKKINKELTLLEEKMAEQRMRIREAEAQGDDCSLMQRDLEELHELHYKLSRHDTRHHKQPMKKKHKISKSELLAAAALCMLEAAEMQSDFSFMISDILDDSKGVDQLIQRCEIKQKTLACHLGGLKTLLVGHFKPKLEPTEEEDF